MPQDNKKFSEELKKRIYNWILRLIKFLDILNKNDSLCRTVDGQLIRCGTSIGANVRESQNAESKTDFIHKLKIAAKEADETEYWLLLCKNSEGFANCDTLLNNCSSIIKVLSKIIASSKTKPSH